MCHKDYTAKILIADVCQLFREKMKQLIADNFHSIMIAEVSNEQGVLNEMSQHTFDVVILDIELSDEKGLQILQKIKNINPMIPVLVMSMFPIKQYEEFAFKAGAYCYLSKVNMANDLIPILMQLMAQERNKLF